MVKLQLFPLYTVLFPNSTLHLHIFEERYKEMINTCIKEQANFGVVLIKEGSESGGPAVPYLAGTEAKIAEIQKLPQGRFNLVVKGTRRFKINELDRTRLYLQAEIEWLDDTEYDPAEVSRLRASSEDLFKTYLRYLSVFINVPELEDLSGIDTKGYSFLVADLLQIDLERKQELLELSSLEERLRREIDILTVFSEKRLAYVV